MPTMTITDRIQSALVNEHWLQRKRSMKDYPVAIQLHEMRMWLISPQGDTDSGIPDRLDRKFQVMDYLVELIRDNRVEVTDLEASLSWQLKTAKVL
jgi:hypothetical protein